MRGDEKSRWPHRLEWRGHSERPTNRSRKILIFALDRGLGGTRRDPPFPMFDFVEGSGNRLND